MYLADFHLLYLRYCKANMDELERFLSLFLKELKTSGYLETIEKYGEGTIRLGFEILAEIAVSYFKDIVRCFSCFKNNSDSESSYSKSNPFIEILLKLLKLFSLVEFKTIQLYINAVISLIDKLLKKYRSEKSSSGKDKEPYLPIVPYQPINIKRCGSCTCASMGDTFSQPRADTGASSMSRYTGVPTRIPDTRQMARDQRGTSSMHSGLNSEHRGNVGANSIHVTVNTQHSSNIGSTSRMKMSINTQHMTNTEANSIPMALNTPTRTYTVPSTTFTSINTMHRTNIEANNKSMRINNFHGANIEASNKSMRINTLHATNIAMASNTPKTTDIKSIVGCKRTNNTNFQGVERKIHYYVGGVSLHTSGQDIIDYFQLNIPDGNFECIKLTTKGRMQSFKLTANAMVKKQLENPKNWPAGVKVHQWVRKDKMPPKQIQASCM